MLSTTVFSIIILTVIILLSLIASKLLLKVWNIYILSFVWIIFSLLILSTSPENVPLDSEHIIKEYIRSSYDSEIKKEDIIEILNSNEPDVNITEFNIYNIPTTNSKSIKIKFRKGNPIYDEGEYSFVVGERDEKIFVEVNKKEA